MDNDSVELYDALDVRKCGFDLYVTIQRPLGALSFSTRNKPHTDTWIEGAYLTATDVALFGGRGGGRGSRSLSGRSSRFLSGRSSRFLGG